MKRTRKQLQPCKTVANPQQTGFEGTDEQLCMDVEPCRVPSWELGWPGGKTMLLFLTDCETKSLVATEFAAKKCQLMSSLLENITALRSVPRQTQTLDREHTGLQQNSSH